MDTQRLELARSVQRSNGRRAVSRLLINGNYRIFAC